MIDKVMTEEMKQKLREGIKDAVTSAGDWELYASREYMIDFDGLNLCIFAFDNSEDGYTPIAKYRIDFTRI